MQLLCDLGLGQRPEYSRNVCRKYFGCASEEMKRNLRLFLSVVLLGLVGLSGAVCAHCSKQREENLKNQCRNNLRTLNTSVICLGIDTNSLSTINWADSDEVRRHITLRRNDTKTCPSGGEYKFRFVPGEGYLGAGALRVECTFHGDLMHAQQSSGGDSQPSAGLEPPQK